jgi:hypothetical protein
MAILLLRCSSIVFDPNDERGLRELARTHRQAASGSLHNAAGAALLLPLVLLGCSALTLPQEDMPASGPDPAFNGLVVQHLKSFKDYASYNAFEISAFRWVHSVKGWSWLTCVRFQDHDHTRIYALFIKDGAIINSRYAVATDGCGTQNYTPLDQMAGATRPARAGALDPLY